MARRRLALLPHTLSLLWLVAATLALGGGAREAANLLRAEAPAGSALPFAAGRSFADAGVPEGRSRLERTARPLETTLPAPGSADHPALPPAGHGVLPQPATARAGPAPHADTPGPDRRAGFQARAPPQATV